MNQFDIFTEETERNLNVETSSRKLSIDSLKIPEKCKTSNNNINTIEATDNNDRSCFNSNIQSKFRFSVISNSECNNSSKKEKATLFQRSSSPVYINNLSVQPSNNAQFENYMQNKIVQGAVVTNTSQFGSQDNQVLKTSSPSRSIASKRRSLIQPIMVHNDNRYKMDTSNGSIDMCHSFYKTIEKSTINENLSLSLIDSDISHNSIENSFTSPSLADSNNVNDLLKNLANKELELLESKRKIEELRKKLIYHEKLYEQQHNDLKKLKDKVSKYLNDKSVMSSDISRFLTKKGVQIKEELVQSTPKKSSPIIKQKSNDIGNNMRLLSPISLGVTKRNSTNISLQRDETRKTSTGVRNEPNTVTAKLDSIDYETPKKPQLKNESIWSKSFIFFDQFDQLLQSELEKSLNWYNETENESGFIVEIEKSEYSEKIRSGCDTTNAKYKQSNSYCVRNKSDVEKSHPQHRSEFLSGNISTSLWGFVSNVREGLLGIYDTVAEDRSILQNQTTMKKFNTTKKND